MPETYSPTPPNVNGNLLNDEMIIKAFSEILYSLADPPINLDAESVAMLYTNLWDLYVNQKAS